MPENPIATIAERFSSLVVFLRTTHLDACLPVWMLSSSSAVLSAGLRLSVRNLRARWWRSTGTRPRAGRVILATRCGSLPIWGYLQH